MISDQKLQYLKDEYSGHKLIYVRFSNEDFVFKTLTVKEYELILRMYQDEFKRETAICNVSCVYPEDYEFAECEFGVLPSIISGYIKKLSDFEDTNDIFKEYDSFKSSYNMYQQCMDLIKAFIGDYTYDEMEDWTWQKLMEMTVRAENIAKLKGYDYHLEHNENAQVTENHSINNEQDIQAVLSNQINPLIYFKDEFEKEQTAKNNSMVQQPFIIGINWSNKELLNGFRKQKGQRR